MSGLYLSKARRARGELRPFEATSLRAIVDRCADRLRAMMDADGVNQREMGDRIGTVQSTVSNLLNRRWNDVKIGTLVRMAHVLHGEVVVSIRWRNPLVVAADPSGTLFKCACGTFTTAGPNGEIVAGAPDGPDGAGRWTLWAKPGGDFVGRIAAHVGVCRFARERYRVKSFT